MPRVNLEKNSFVAGEVTPQLYGRTDLAQYGQGCRSLENCIVRSHGGVVNRPGFRFVASTKFPTKRSRLIPFQVSTEASYIVEAGDNYFRFYVNNGLLDDGMGSPVEVSTPYDQNDVFLLQWAQEADVMYIVHPNLPVYKLSRTSITTFTLDKVTWNKGRAPIGPFNTDPDNELSTNAVGTTYDRRITFDKDTFSPTDVGRIIYVKSEGTPGSSVFYEIKQYISTKIVEVDTLSFEDSATPPATSTWALGLLDDTHGCTAVAFHQGRLVLAGFTRQVDYIAFSVTDDFESFEIESADTDLTDADNADRAITRRTVSSQVNAIRWIRAAEGQLIVGTSGGEFRIRGDNEDSLTPTGAVVSQVTSRGSTEVPGIVVDNQIFFIERSNAVLRRFGYVSSGSSASLTSANFSILSEHLLRDGGGANSMVYMQYPYSSLWMTMQNGQLVSWAYEAEQEVSGPSRHILGGSFLGKDPVAESLAVSQSTVPINQRTEQTGFTASATSLLTNPDAETGDTSGWTFDGTWTASTGSGSLTPHGGAYMFLRTSAGITETLFHQTVDLSTLVGFNNVLVDEGQTTIDVIAYVGSTTTNDYRWRVVALDSSDVELADLYNDGLETATPNVWDEKVGAEMPLPPLTRKIKFELTADNGTAGSGAGVALDDVTLFVTQESIIPETTFDGNEDRVWAVVKRTINGSTARYVEYMESPWSVALPADATDLERTNRVDHAFYVDSGLTLNNPILVTEVSRANPAVVTAPAHGLSNGDEVMFRNIVGMTDIDHYTFTVANKTADTFELSGVDSTGYGAFVAQPDSYVYLRVSSLSGLDHLEGQEVAILADGVPQPMKTVSGGSIALDRDASLVHVGLPYNSTGTTMSAVYAGPWGTSLGAPSKVAKVTANVFDTIGLEFGIGDSPEVWDYEPQTPTLLGRGPVPYTGFEDLSIEASHEDLPAISFRQMNPLPFTLLALYIDFEVQPL